MEMKHNEFKDGLRLYAEKETRRMKEEAQATPRDALVAAINNTICASIKRDREGAAEELVEALGRVIVEQIRGELNLRDVCKTFMPYWSEEQRATVSQWLKDPWAVPAPPYDDDLTIAYMVGHQKGKDEQRLSDPDILDLIELLKALPKVLPFLDSELATKLDSDSGDLARPYAKLKARYA